MYVYMLCCTALAFVCLHCCLALTLTLPCLHSASSTSSEIAALQEMNVRVVRAYLLWRYIERALTLPVDTNLTVAQLRGDPALVYKWSNTVRTCASCSYKGWLRRICYSTYLCIRVPEMVLGAPITL